MAAQEKIQKAVEIFKANFSDAKGKFRAALSSANGNVVEIYADGIPYCAINIKSGSAQLI